LSHLVVSKRAKEFARSHSYECADSGQLVPTAGIRFIAEIVGDCFVFAVAVSIGLCVILNGYAHRHDLEFHDFQITRDTAKNVHTESLAFAQKAQALMTITFIVGIAINLFFRFFGVTVGFHLFSLKTVNKSSRKTANFLQMILFDPLTIIFLAITCYQHFCDDSIVFNKLSELVTYVLYADVLFCLYLLVMGTYPTEDLFGLQVVVDVD